MPITAMVPAWTGSVTTRSATSVTDPTMFSDITGYPDRLQLPHGPGYVAAHDGAGKQEGSRAVEVRDGPNRGRQIGLADEWDRVHADLLAPEVVAIRFAHGSEDRLGNLRAAAHDDEPLAEDLVQGLGEAATAQ